MINLSKVFDLPLGVKEINNYAIKILNDNSAIKFSPISRKGFEDYVGLTVNDYTFDKAYCNITNQNNIFNYQIFNHEIMHGIDFYIQNKIP